MLAHLQTLLLTLWACRLSCRHSPGFVFVFPFELRVPKSVVSGYEPYKWLEQTTRLARAEGSKCVERFGQVDENSTLLQEKLLESSGRVYQV